MELHSTRPVGHQWQTQQQEDNWNVDVVRKSIACTQSWWAVTPCHFRSLAQGNYR